MAKDRMKVRLEEIPSAGLDVALNGSEPRFAELLSELSDVPGPRSGEAKLHLEIWPERIDVTGEVDVQVPATCDRCLEPFSVQVKQGFSQYLMRSVAPDPDAAPDEEIELTLRDLDRSALVGDVVDIADVLREELLLAMPSKSVCKEECKGICAGCGAELNHEPCTCEAQIDPRWEILADLKLES